MTKAKRDPGKMLVSVVMLFFFSAFLLIAVKDNPLKWQGFALAAAVPAMMWVGTMVLPKLFPADKLLLSLTNFLCALGVLVLYSTDTADTNRGFTQAVFYGVGIVCMVICIFLVRWIKLRWRWPIRLLYPVSLALIALPLAIGKEINGAKNWIYIAGISVQPSEIVKLSLLIILSYYMSRRKMLPWLFFSVCCLGVLMLQKDLGTALMYYVPTLFLFYASTSNLPLTLLGAGGGAGAAALGYAMFAHVKKRVAVWRNPWADYDNAGFQIVQALVAIASGGLFGVGLGLGSPRVIPVYHTDMIFAVICEQFGIIFGLCVLMMYAAIIIRGATIAMGARYSFHALLAMGCTVILGVQTFIIIGGVIKLIPLTGVTMPFVSYGGTSLVSSLCIIGLLQGVSSLNEDDLKEDTRLANLGRGDSMME